MTFEIKQWARPSSHGKHFIYGSGIMRWFNSWGPDTALWFELMHELGERVNLAQESEDLGYGALFDLSYEEYVRLTEGASEA